MALCKNNVLKLKKKKKISNILHLNLKLKSRNARKNDVRNYH